MKFKHLAIKSTLNSFFVILGAFIILQAVGYVRDAILLQTGSVSEFLSSFLIYMGTRVLPVLLFFLIFIYRRARRIEHTVREITSRDDASEEERDTAIKIYSSHKRLVMILNLIGFVVGYLIDLIILGEIGLILELDRLAQLLFNLSGGVLYATAQISINGMIFSEAREHLRI